MGLLRSSAIVGGYTMVSRVLGFLRDILIAALLGAGPVADAFFVAFKFPNFFRRLFAEGAFSAAFVPAFSGHLAEGGTAAARIFAERTLAVLLVVLLALLVAAEIAMPWLMYGMAPGFARDPDKFQLAILFTRITFPYLLFISVVSLMGGVLNSLGRFAAAAATPILLNLVLIGALVLAAPRLPTAGHALAWGLAVAGVLQFLWLAGACARAGMALRLPRPALGSDVKRLLRLMLPGAIGAGVVQINLVVDVILASLLASGSVSYLYYADRVNQLPIGVVGVAVGTALLPLLSRQLRAGETAAAMNSQNRAIEFVLLLGLPAAAALMVIAAPVVSVLFERGAFGADASQATALALVAYGAGLPSFLLIKVLAPGFFAREDTATPVKIGVAAMLANLVLNLILMGPLGHVGIALATTLSGWLNAGALVWLLHRRGHLVLDSRLRGRLPRTLLASAGLAAALLLAHRAL
ncbi:MAG: murein biosynthesis integral membrane protein MurJ, partial [Alphaproteobacteria bacterium]